MRVAGCEGKFAGNRMIGKVISASERAGERARMSRISTGSWMTATAVICHPHLGHTSGPIS